MSRPLRASDSQTTRVERAGRESSRESARGESSAPLDTLAEAPSTHDDEAASVPKLSRLRSIGIVTACTLVMVGHIGSGSTFVALPTIGKDLDIQEGNLQWIPSAYNLTAGAFLLHFGRLADLHGRRSALLLGMTWFTAFAIGCAFAPSEIALDVLRGFQGMGSAAAVPAAVGILAQSFEMGSAMRTLAFAIFSSGAPVGASVGNVVSSLLVQYTSPTWHAIFYFQACLAAFTGFLALLVVPRDTHHLRLGREDRRVDWVGSALVSSGLVLLTFALGDGEGAPRRWRTPYIIALLVVAVHLILAFVLWEYRLEGRALSRAGEDEKVPHGPEKTGRLGSVLDAPPMLPPSFFKRGGGTLGVMVTLVAFVWAGFNSWIYHAVLYYQSYFGLSPVDQMLRILPMSILSICLCAVVALIVSRLPGLVIIASGALITSIACVLFATIDTTATYWTYGFFAALCSVFGADFIFAGGSIYVAKVSKAHEQSLAGGLFNTFAQVGTSIGLAISSIVLDQTMGSDGNSAATAATTNVGDSASGQQKRDALLRALRAVQWLNFAFVLTGFVLAILFLRNIGYIVERAPRGSLTDEESGPTTQSASRPLSSEDAFGDTSQKEKRGRSTIPRSLQHVENARRPENREDSVATTSSARSPSLNVQKGGRRSESATVVGSRSPSRYPQGAP